MVCSKAVLYVEGTFGDKRGDNDSWPIHIQRTPKALRIGQGKAISRFKERDQSVVQFFLQGTLRVMLCEY